MIETLCGDCKDKELKYEYHFPHPEEWYWYCNTLKRKLTPKLGIMGGVYRSARCPKLLAEATSGKSKEADNG